MKSRIALFLAVFTLNAFAGLVTTMIMPGADRIVRIMVATGDVLMVLLAATTILRNRQFLGVSLFLALIGASLITLIYNFTSVGAASHFNGLRQPLYFLSAIIVVHDLLQSTEREFFVRLFTRYLVLFAILQTPLSVIQFLQYGAGDGVGGTYGTAGGSGYVTQFLFLIAFYLVVVYGSGKDGETFSLTKIALFSLLLVPCALNETKISFLYLALFVVGLAFTRRQAYKMVPVLLFGAGLMYFLVSYYTEYVGQVQEIFDERFLERYLLHDSRRGMDIPRFQKVFLMLQLLSNDPVNFLFGMGYGLFMGRNILGLTDLSRSLFFFGGTRNQLTGVWIQGGLAAVVILITATFQFLRKQLHLPTAPRRFRLFLAIILASVWLYNEALTDRVFTVIAAYFIGWVSLPWNDERQDRSGEEPAAVTATGSDGPE